MLFSKSFLRKANQFRKQKWSAPTVMGVFILICMMLVFGFESLGIAQKEKNLDYRIVTPEKCKSNFFYFLLILVIETITKDKISSISKNKANPTNKDLEVVSERIKVLTMKNKEEQTEQLMNMLVKGAHDQINYLKDTQEYMDANLEEDDKSFLDI